MAKLLSYGFVLLICGFAIAQDDPTNLNTTQSPPVTTLAPDTTLVPDTTLPPDTTTAPETTTTPEAPTTTPAPAPNTTTSAPTTPAPAVEYKYNITENNVTCIMIEGSVSFMVNYTDGTNITKTATISLPKHPKADFQVSGTCNGSDGLQRIIVQWGAENETSSVNVAFALNETWSVQNFTANLYMDPLVFVNGTDAGKTLSLVVDYGFSPMGVAVNHSFNCHSDISAVDVNGEINGATYSQPITSKLDGIHIQAYNQIPNEPDFVTSIHCSADQTSDVVPIAVGCALAALVVIVLIAYLVGRRRRSAAYQSV